MQIVIFVFNGMTVLDAVGPYEVLSRLPGANVLFAGLQRGNVRSENQFLALSADVALHEVTACDLLVVPGGLALKALERNLELLGELRRLDAISRVTASVCTGSLLLAAAGLLEARCATTHFAYRQRLAAYRVTVKPERVLRDGKYFTGAGVSAGLDLALDLAAELASPQIAQAIQLAIEYDPKPSFDAGHPERAPRQVRELVLSSLRAREAAAEPIS